MSERIENIRQAVEAMHGCKAVHEGSFPIRETFGKQTVWEGVVESFAITGHPTAKRCYGWLYDEMGKTRYAGVLELPPVTSPLIAVRAWIVAEVKKQRSAWAV